MAAGGSVAERLAHLRRRIDEACRRAGRDPRTVRLIGASKAQPPERLREAWDAGLRRFGENRVQEALAKAKALPAGIEWHFFGALQSNKVRPAMDLFTTYHAVDRLKIARALDREAGRREATVDVFLEVNLGEEPSKHGFPPPQLAASVEPLTELRHLRVVGLMAVPPLTADPEGARPWFRTLRRLRDELAGRPEWEGFPGRLSMGMSGDFEVAVEEGATEVRVGTALFGPRPMLE
jgi:pyridoxal phosphate enzyme (YggS family)